MQIDIPKKKPGRPGKMPDEKTLAELYANHTSTEIAEKYDVSPSTVRSWASRIRKKNN